MRLTTDVISCPQERRTNNRRRIVNEWRRRPEYKEASAAFLKKHPWCEIWLEVGVKIPATEVHHPNEWSYKSFEIYVDFENNGAMAVSGSRNGGGHFACHHDLKVCPICKKRKCNRFAEACRSCLVKKYPALKVKLEAAKEQQRLARNARERKRKQKKAADRHPCSRRGLEQRCMRKPGEVCTFNAKNAHKCRHFRAKEVTK